MAKNTLKKQIVNNAVKSNWVQKTKDSHQDNDWRQFSFLIALKVLRHIRKNSLTQKEIATKMDCSPQFLNKILKGNENLTLETIFKLQNATGISLIEIPSFEKNAKYVNPAKSYSKIKFDKDLLISSVEKKIYSEFAESDVNKQFDTKYAEAA